MSNRTRTLTFVVATDDHNFKQGMAGVAAVSEREMAKAAKAVDIVDKAVQNLSGGTKRLTDAQRAQLVEQGRVVAASKREEAALRTLGLSQAEVNAHVGAYNNHLGTAKRRAEEAVATNAVLTGSWKSMARQAVTAGAGFAAAYVGISKGRDAIHTTEELAHATEILHRNTGLSIKSSSDWIAVAHVRGIQTGTLQRSFQSLAKTYLAADAGQKASVQTLKALGVSQADVHRGALDFNFALDRTVKGLGAMQGGSARLVISQKLLGRGAKDLAPLFAGGAKGLEEQLGMARKYGVELNSKTLPLLNRLVENQREMKFASLGLKVAFTEAVAPGLLDVEQAALRVVKVFRDPTLTDDQKWQKIGDILGPLATKLEHGFEQALPHIANRVAREVPHIAETFVNGFMHADIWGKLLISGWLLKKFGGPGAFVKLGRASGVEMGTGMAEGASSGKVASRFGVAGSKLGKVLGIGIGVAAAPEIIKALGGALGVDPKSALGQELARAEKQGTIKYLLGTAGIGSGVDTAGDPRPGHGDVTRTPRTGAVHTDAQGNRWRRNGDGTYTQIAQGIPRSQRGSGPGTNLFDSTHPSVAGPNAIRNPAWEANHASVDQSRKSLDAYTKSADHARASTDGLHKKVGDTGSIAKLRSEVNALHTRLGGLDKGTQSYRDTAEQLRRKQGQLTAAIAAGKPAADHTRGGFGTLATTASNLADTVAGVARSVTGTTNQVLKGFGAKEIKFAIGAVTNVANQTAAAFSGKASGGIVVGQPGDRGFDDVPLLIPEGWAVVNGPQQRALGLAGGGMVPTMVGRGELLVPPAEQAGLDAIAQARGYGSLDGLFSTVSTPHYLAKGGRVGSLPSMVAEANRVDSRHFPYRWGGGHNPNFTGPYDCSGAVSDVLHAGGLLGAPMVASQFMNYGLPGPGDVTLYASPSHVYMSLAGRFWGTSNSNPGGGAGWFPGGPRPGFVVRHAPAAGSGAGAGGGGAGLLGAPQIKGPAGPLRDIARGASRKMTVAANRKVQAAMMATTGGGQFGGGDLGNLAGRPFKGGGNFVSTAYGPPWGGIQGGGTTATGVDLHGSPRAYIVAVDPSVIPLHSRMRITPNPFNYAGQFVAEDTGGAIKGNRIDFYDWLGRRHQNAWGRRNVHVQGFSGGGFVNPISGPSPHHSRASHPRAKHPKHPRNPNAPRPYVVVDANGHQHVVVETPSQHRANAIARHNATVNAQNAVKHAEGLTASIAGGADAIIASLAGRATGYDDTFTDQGTDYDFAQRHVEQTADDTTEAGRAAHIAGLKGLQGRKTVQELALIAKRKMILLEVRRARQAIKQLLTQRRRAPAKARKGIDARIKHFQSVIAQAKKAAHQVGLTIAGNELDILALAGNIKDVQAKAPTAIDTANEHIALAALTPDGADDTAAAAELVSASEGELAAAIKSGDVARITAAAQGLKAARDAQGASQQALVDAITSLKSSIDQQNAFAQSITAVTGREALRALADVINGNLGAKTNQRLQTPSIGNVARD